MHINTFVTIGGTFYRGEYLILYILGQRFYLVIVQIVRHIGEPYGSYGGDSPAYNQVIFCRTTIFCSYLTESNNFLYLCFRLKDRRYNLVAGQMLFLDLELLGLELQTTILQHHSALPCR